MAYLDLSELSRVFRLSPWWKRHRPGWARFVRSDYLGPSHLPLDEAVRQRVYEESKAYPKGPIRMLTHLRYVGYCFNPVTFYYGFNDDGETLEWILAEITNTPWNERHSYFLPIAQDNPQRSWEFPKDFHVSPLTAWIKAIAGNLANRDSS